MEKVYNKKERSCLKQRLQLTKAVRDFLYRFSRKYNINTIYNEAKKTLNQ